MDRDPKTGVPLLGSVKPDNTARLPVEERLDQLEEFARWVVANLGALSEQNAHISGALVSIIENAKALHEVKTPPETTD